MKKTSAKLSAFSFWSYASWAIIFINALITSCFYYVWIPYNFETTPHSLWISTTYELSDFYTLFFLNFLLVASRALDFTAKPFQIFCFFFTLILIALNCIFGVLLWNNYDDVVIIVRLLIISLTAICTLLFLFLGFVISINEYIYFRQKIFLVKGLLSFAAKIIIWLPFILNSKFSERMVIISFIYVVIMVIFSMFFFIYQKHK